MQIYSSICFNQKQGGQSSNVFRIVFYASRSNAKVRGNGTENSRVGNHCKYEEGESWRV
jgi:hypothetical protein